METEPKKYEREYKGRHTVDATGSRFTLLRVISTRSEDQKVFDTYRLMVEVESPYGLRKPKFNNAIDLPPGLGTEDWQKIMTAYNKLAE